MVLDNVGRRPFPTKRTYLNTPHNYVRFRAIDTCDLVVDTNHSLTAWHSLRLRRHRQLRAVCVLLYSSYMFDRYDEVGHVGHRESYPPSWVYGCASMVPQKTIHGSRSREPCSRGLRCCIRQNRQNMFGPCYTRMRFVQCRPTIVDSADHVSRWDKQSDHYHIVQYKILAMPNCDGHCSGVAPSVASQCLVV